MPNFMKIHPVGDELFHADGGTDGQTNTTKLIVAFRNFAKAHKIGWRKSLHNFYLYNFFLGGGGLVE